MAPKEEGIAFIHFVAICVVIFFQGVGGESYGEGISTCPTKSGDLKAQLCPRNNNDHRYVRIKTFNGKYFWAYGTENGDNSYVRTRCCGKNDNVGRIDSTYPGTRTTFRVHCNANKDKVRFEVLSTKNGVNRHSGYFLYADVRYKLLYAKKRPAGSDANSLFIVKRWRGPVIAIKSSNNIFWWSFLDERDGKIPISSVRVRNFPDFPPLHHAFTLEIVPRGCVEVRTSERILAAPRNTKPMECHSKPDRCYWTTGWEVGRRRMAEGTCYYMKHSMCYQPNAGSRQRCPQQNAKDCEAASCCFDYQRNECYRGIA